MTNFLGEKGPDPKHSMASEATAFIYSIPGFQFQAFALFFPSEIEQKLGSVSSQRRKVQCQPLDWGLPSCLLPQFNLTQNLS